MARYRPVPEQDPDKPAAVAPYQQSRAALRQIYGSRRIDASAPNVSRYAGKAPPGGMGGLSDEGEWRRFFGPKPTSTPTAAPMLWQRMRENTTRANVGNKPIGDQMWAGVRADTNPIRGIGMISPSGVPQGKMTGSSLAPESPPDVSGVASLYEPPPQFGGPRNLLQDPSGYGSFEDPIGGSSAFLRKYGRMRDLTSLGQDSWTL